MTLTVDAPAFRVHERGNGLRVEWHPSWKKVRKALFVEITDDGVLQLEHIMTICVSARETWTETDTSPSLDDLPNGVVYALRGAGYDVAHIRTSPGVAKTGGASA